MLASKDKSILDKSKDNVSDKQKDVTSKPKTSTLDEKPKPASDASKGKPESLDASKVSAAPAPKEITEEEKSRIRHQQIAELQQRQVIQNHIRTKKCSIS